MLTFTKLSWLLVLFAFAAAAVPATAASAAKTLTGVTSVSAGEFHTCAVAKKRAYCWGKSSGDLGSVAGAGSKVPILVRGAGTQVESVAAGGSESCAATKTAVKCWGQINGDDSYATAPRLVRHEKEPVTAISLGSDSQFPQATTLCVIFRADFGCKALAPGNGLESVLNLGGIPTAVGAGSPNCAVVAGAAKCWGQNYDGKLGNGTNASAEYPTVVVGLGADVTAVANGKQHVCAIVNSGVKCWGTVWPPAPGQDQRSNVPVDVPTLDSGVTAIAAGAGFTCAIINGGVKCWGAVPMGDSEFPTTLDVSTPTPIAGLSQGVTAISAGGLHACAIVGGELKCWGYNGDGQLGNGGFLSSSAPVTVAGPGRAIRIRGHHQAKAMFSADYGDGGVAVRVRFPVPPHVWFQDACVGRVSFSVSGGGVKKETARARVAMRYGTCVANWLFGPRSKKHQDVVVRARTKGNTVVRPARFKRTVEYYTCWSSDCR